MSSALKHVSIVIPAAPGETAHEHLLEDLKGTAAEIIISSEGSRAKSLNTGAAKAGREFLWFLHADSRVSAANIAALEQSLRYASDALHYFDLTGLPLLNSLGANMRSRLFGLPYGDQGFAISKIQFEELGGYPQNVEYGEDLLFVRKAKSAGVRLRRVPSKLHTSGRAYKEHGWMKLTTLRQWQLFKLMGQKI